MNSIYSMIEIVNRDLISLLRFIHARCSNVEPQVEDNIKYFIRDTFFSKAIFEFLYKEGSRLFGETASRQLLYRIMKEATKMATEEAKEDGYLDKFLDVNKPCESFKFIYSVFGINEVECELKGNKVHLKIKNCPLPDLYDKEKTGRACIVMLAILAGMVEAIMNKKVYIETPVVRFGNPRPDVVVKMVKNKVMGDPYCEFVAEMKG